MNKGISCLLAIGLLGTATGTALRGAEASAQKPVSEAPAKPKKSKRESFRGKLRAMDRAAMTITVEGKEKTRIIHITSHTRTYKADKPATLSDAVIGEDIAGQVIKNAAGEEEAVTLRLVEKPQGKPAEKKAKKSDGEKKE